MGIICTDKMNLVAAHSLETDPDVCLDMLEHVAEMNRTVSVW
ncbi:methionyl-tRNA synthetase domain protein [Yersinia pestis PY-13]|uniref:Methionyl-tRNA synthetase domain protein n=1 Tax=Yersinia pestis PY-08 TaxID=992134 RepID=A0AB72ZKN5_YERPE|nr:methionyl-tRNA synthetase domain protein [Yersinia pestis PY-04]EIR05362.1 methionyl-tRNA synthetase domain protein [Yersinia pestis PY-05]EIR08072.1 methionyl-tRNA synthetase domain protein [Yersinia pestis PY-06]EIR19374.1 methionyl-tRNA synthetase domain protein [Yersinia pestis PY-07]EIR20355.1 methionyl-tRNA synthetase domain protein [Yersinia pestis PY-08]EIR22199.1 methionyl-tRNA synthetase domain protein [Yersinia pestis PY-09]EIR34150.1 methionyl-tRNA synthetase domain protein [Ye